MPQTLIHTSRESSSHAQSTVSAAVNFMYHNLLNNGISTVQRYIPHLCVKWFLYRNKWHIQLLYDGFKLAIGCIKPTKFEAKMVIIIC